MAATVYDWVTVASSAQSSLLTSSANLSATTGIAPSNQQPSYPNLTFTTITSVVPSNTSNSNFFPVPTTLDVSASFACSLYANFSIQGCPPPTSGTPSITPPPAGAVTAFVTVTQLVGQETCSPIETTSTTPSTTAGTTVF